MVCDLTVSDRGKQELQQQYGIRAPESLNIPGKRLLKCILTPIKHCSIPMPEIHFKIQWPDGSEETCYSPSSVVKEYFTPNTDYVLKDFVARSRDALLIASDRVQAKYGRPCGLALGQLQTIETKSAQFQDLPQSKVRFIDFI
jgi:uncharacterized repeat protein (TIGR04042 family)